MKRTLWWTAALAVALAAAPAPAAEPETPRAVALLPASAIGFLHVPDIAGLEQRIGRFAEQTGWQLGGIEQSILDVVGRRTGIRDGLDPAGNMCIGFVDPKRFRERYTIYVLPVADWDALLASTQAEMMSPGLYALTGTIGPRFVRRRGAYAVVTSSIRTMDAVSDEKSLAEVLRPETRRRAAGADPLVYVNIDSLTRTYEAEIASWFRASSGKVYDQPHALPYADMLVTYMLGIASLMDQIETIELVPRFEAEGLAADLAIRFAKGGSIAEFTSSQKPGALPLPIVMDRPVASSTTIRIDRGKRSDLAIRATRFFVETAPRPEPLPESTKATVEQAVAVFVNSLGENMMFLSAPAGPGLGLSAEVSVYDLDDPVGFDKGLTLLVNAWERLADQLRLYLKFKMAPEPETVAGISVKVFKPRMRFGIPSRHIRFQKRLRGLFGPEGLVYRVAVVGNRAVVATGSDLTLLRKVIEQLKAGKEPEAALPIERLHTHLSRDQNILIATSLPVYLKESLVRGGTPDEEVGEVDPGKERVGVGIRFHEATANVATYWPHEQIRLARELIQRVAPGIEKAPESLFAPEGAGPPAAGQEPGAAQPAPAGP